MVVVYSSSSSLFGEPDDAASGLGHSTPTSTPPSGNGKPVHQVALTWPIVVVIVLGVIGLIVAAFMSPMTSTYAYAILIVVGCGLLFYRRLDAIRVTRSAGGTAVLTIDPLEKAAIASLVLGCLANGIVIAMEVAAWPVWTDIREQIF